MATLSALKADLLFLPSTKIKLGAALGVTLIVFLILFLLQPFNSIIHGFTLTGIIRITSYALTAGVTILISELYLIKYFKELFSRGGLYVPLLWYFFEVILATSLIFVCKNAWSGFEYATWADYWLVIQRGASISIFPLIILSIFVLSRKQGDAKIRLHSEHKTEFLTIEEDQLLFLQSDDNYTTVFYHTNSSVKKKILRGSLSSFEQQLSFPMIRCHRSFIVNLKSIETLKGNSQGYQLNLSHFDDQIKVSRKYITQFNHSWERFCQSEKAN